MHSDKLRSQSSVSDKIVLNKETQTPKSSNSNSSVKSSTKSLPPRPPLPRDVDKTEKGSVSIFEFYQILHEPESPKSITIVKETVSEEIYNHFGNGTTEDAISNRYRYCKEVIKPYLKSHSKECPDSDEQLIKGALDSIGVDFPDYQPCFEVKNNNDKGGKENSDNSFSKVDASVSCASKYSTSRMELEKNKECAKDNKSSIESKKTKCKTSSSSLSTPKCPRPIDSCKDVIPPTPQNPCNLHDSGETSIPKTDKRCPSQKDSGPCVKEPTIGIEPGSEGKPTFVLTERCGDNDHSSASIQTECMPKSMIDAHNETMATLKCAMEDFIGKVCKTTKDAVTLITTESAKQLEKMRKSESCNTDTAPKKVKEDKRAETATTFNFFRRTSNQQETKDQGTISRADSLNPTEMFEKISGKVDSVISVFNESMASLPGLPKILTPSNFNDTSSEYDVPKPPKDISNVIKADPVGTSVFTALKSKFFSMFSDGNAKQTMSESSSNSSHESDDDLADRFNN